MPGAGSSPSSRRRASGGASRRADPKNAAQARRVRGPSAPAPAPDDSYWRQSMRPLHVLLFLLPLIVLYEVGSALYLADVAAGTRETIKAYRLMGDFFNVFGIAGLFMPGVALVTVLLVWQFLSGDRWVVRWNTIAGMAAECVAWTLPLVVLSAASRSAANMAPSGGIDPMAALNTWMAQVGPGPAPGLEALSWQAKLSISIGAGLYEEMLFRLVGIALIHFVLRDLLGAREVASSVLAVVGSAVIFALYHDLSNPAGSMNYFVFGFLTLAGCFLGAVYVLRGFGIVVGTHALYDIVVLVLLTPGAHGHG